ncbi:MAG: cyclic-di-AMP receptor [Firmicutes bacterium]|jgi:uncharacterized protein YaaQ|uniref:Transcriptional regulator n=1 Tax=Sulfobacillus benefaciens TaxID=453960 RepID=A0A2T2X0J8_9FIRM|nr:cyclic-di-AMP receptor [Bacillota bacterium]MCL5014952.1 cyclic-di-AMP receptor [Bacillota bacterium]PSR28013.1 MAG: hypothetical protein C7B43_10675 [Sulfobacillus benefaciens]HBQ94298.1 hypothetical protein [Sulfobacillus sp.]
MVVNQLLIVIVQSRDAPRVSSALRQAQIAFTQFTSRGSFLNLGNTTFMIGTEDIKVPEILEIIQKHCRERESLVEGFPTLHPDLYAYPVSVRIGGAIVFSLPVEHYVRFS